MPCYFFSGNQYIRVTRRWEGPGTVDPGYPGPISVWGWGEFGKNGIDAALYSGPVDYFFSGNQYIRVTRGATGPGRVDPGYPAPISVWGWGEFGKDGIDAALWSDTVCYFFKGSQYIRVTRGDRGPGTVDPGYPAPISVWGWGEFGKNGIDAALNSGSFDYFFSGAQYIRVRRGDVGPGKVDPGYPAPIANWGWKEFGARGIHAALFSGEDFADPAPLAQLASNSNYIMANGGSNVTGVQVTIDITEDLAYSANGAPLPGTSKVNGYTWQLNCYSATGQTDAAQQYAIGFNGSQIYGQINNWKDLSTPLVNKSYALVSMSGSKIPAGTKLRIGLQNDAAGNIATVVFEIRDQNGKVTGFKTVTMTDIVSKADLAPIVAFEMDLVGPGNAESVTFSSGAGTILYQAGENLTASNATPKDVDLGFVTEETGNSTYGQLSATASNTFLQSFGISAAMAKTTGTRGTRFRPRLTPPAPGSMS